MLLAYKCPEKDQYVQTSIEVSKEDFDRLTGFKLALWCPHCDTSHKIAAADTIASEPVFSSSGIQISHSGSPILPARRST